MSYARAGVLGDYTWSDYLAGSQAPANARVTSPNGDVVVFDLSGIPDYTIPHALSGKDADVEHDPSSQFFGWTNVQKNAFLAAKGYVVATDALSAAAVVRPGETVATVPQAAIDASQAALKVLATTDPKVKAALDADSAPKGVQFRNSAGKDESIAQGLLDSYADLAAQGIAQWASVAAADKNWATPAMRNQWLVNYYAAGEQRLSLTVAQAITQGLITADIGTQIKQVLTNASSGSGTSADSSSSSTSMTSTTSSSSGTADVYRRTLEPTTIVDFAPAPVNRLAAAPADDGGGFLNFLKTPLGLAVGAATIYVGARALTPRRRTRGRRS